jgi:2-methylcitrate dehydratase PrpD
MSRDPSGTPITGRLWERFGKLTVDDLPPDVLTVASQCILDWFACATAGSAEPLTKILRDELADYSGPCTVIGSGHGLPPLQAALVNGATGHALDFDDTHTIMGGHPTAPVFPAVWALAEQLDASGAQLLAALVAGFEIEARLGAGIGAQHYAKGWHKTSTIGIFGAAAGSARLLGLDATQFGHAMGLAASQSSGLKANFGTMTKPFHAGHAAERGLLSARLGSRQFTANPDAVQTNQGLAQAAGTGTFDTDAIDNHADDWLILSNLFKYHAACYLTHAAIEAVSTLTARHTDEIDAVRRVRVEVHPSILDVCGIPEPRTGLEGKFSLRATTALGWLGWDTADPATFVDDVIGEPQVQAMLQKVDVGTDRTITSTQTRVTVTTDGREDSAFYDSGIPATDLALQGDRLQAKFQALVGPVLGPDGAHALAERIGGLKDRPSIAGLYPPGINMTSKP